MKRVMLTNLLAYQGVVWMVTITAPGKDVLPWDNETGKVVQHAATAWNRTAARRWRKLNQWATQAVKRELGAGPVKLLRVWQVQERGVLHVHLVLGFDTPSERERAWRWVKKLRERTKEFGFGYVDARDRDGRAGRSTVMEPHRAAGYLSGYLSDSRQLREALELRARPRRVVWVANELTAATGCTMRRLRRVRFLYVIRSGKSSVIFARAGRLPTWFRDPRELALVQGLAAQSP